MGYTTEFSGKMTISPPLQPHMVETVNLFCEERHGGPMQVYEGMPTFWCDWEVSEDGSKIYWNGSEKSYYMDRWLALLIKRFIAPQGSIVSGRMLAQGERTGDVWVLACKDNIVSREEVATNLGITDED